MHFGNEKPFEYSLWCKFYGLSCYVWQLNANFNCTACGLNLTPAPTLMTRTKIAPRSERLWKKGQFESVWFLRLNSKHLYYAWISLSFFHHAEKVSFAKCRHEHNCPLTHTHAKHRYGRWLLTCTGNYFACCRSICVYISANKQIKRTRKSISSYSLVQYFVCLRNCVTLFASVCSHAVASTANAKNWKAAYILHTRHITTNTKQSTGSSRSGSNGNKTDLYVHADRERERASTPTMDGKCDML